MPLSLDDEVASRGAAGLGPQAGGGFDLQGATTLYWKPVPLLLRQPDREDAQEELTFRILTGTSRSNHSMRVLRIHISSEQDLFFMHSLEVSEEDFQSLKTEQGILVDFASFPMKIITLLDKCTTVQPVDATRFQAVLTVRGGESLFRIVETNDFKQLPHITLAFRPGNDAAIKQFLAFRLLEVKSDVEELRAQLAVSQAGHSSANSELAAVRQQLSTLQEQYDKHLLEVQAEAKTQRAHALEERAKERADMKEAHDRELAELGRRHAETVEALSARLEQVDGENRKLREAKYQLDTKVSELSAKLGSAEGANRSLEEECARLRALSTQLGGDKAEKEVLANELRTKLSAAEEKVSAQAEMVEAQRARVRDLESGMRQVEGRAGELKEALAATEARLRDTQAEVAKGNTIIDKLSADLRAAKDKGKRKAAILVRQEEEVAARDAALAAAQREQQALQANVEALRAEMSSLRSENHELRGKLDDSKQQLQSNEQMIRWLNQQVTEAQLGTAAGSLLPSSRYAPYRPALTAGPASHPSSGVTPGNALLPAPGLPPAHGAAVVAATPGSGPIGGGLPSKYTPAAGAYSSGLGGSQETGAAAMGPGTGAAGLGIPPPRPPSSYLPSPAPASRMNPAPPAFTGATAGAGGVGPGTGGGAMQPLSRYGAPAPSEYATPAPVGGMGGGMGFAAGPPSANVPQPVAAGPPSRFFAR